MTSLVSIRSLIRDRMSALYTSVGKAEEEICTDEEEEEEDDDELFSTPHATVVKPLMSPRKRIKLPEEPFGRKRYRLHRQAVIKSVIYLVLLVCLLVGMAFLGLQLIKVLVRDPSSSRHGNKGHDQDSVVGCSKFKVEEVWTRTLHQLLTEAAFRLNDVNRDGTPDVVIGFATGADRYFAEPILCDLYFNGSHPCLGGLLALDGRTGKELWRHYTEHEVFGVNCNVDVNSDGVRDCLGAGRGGVFHAVSGATGELLWRFDEHEAKIDISNLYTPQFIRDMNGDGIQDVLIIHGGDPLREPGKPVEKIGRLIFFSGSTGEILNWVQVPDKQESYYSPQIYYDSKGREVVLFGTGGETHGGSLWAVGLQQLYQGHIHQAKELYRDNFKGVMTPPVLVDLTGDGVRDIIMAMYNSSVLAINGETFDYLWNFTLPMSESYSTPAAGYYNDDDVPDFMIKYAHGPGYPIYYYSQSTILDGKTGRPLLTPYIRDTVGSQNSPLTISVEGHGNDIFLYWISDCEKRDSDKDEEFTFIEGTNVHEQSRSDMCKLRFNSKGYTRMYMMNRQSDTPGTVVYNSEERWELEHQNVVNTSSLAWQYVQKHPQFKKTYTKHLAKQRQLEKGVKKGNTATGSRQQSKKTSVSATSPSTGNIHSSFSGNDKRKKPKKDNQGTRSGKEKYRDYDEAMDDGNTRFGSWSPHDDKNHRQGKTPTRTHSGDWQVQTPWRYPYFSGTTWPQGLNLDSGYHEDMEDRRTYLGDTVSVPGRRGDSNMNYLGNFRDFPMDGEQRGINGPYRYLTNPYGKYSTQEPFEAAYRQLESMDYPTDIWKHLLGQPDQGERYRMFEPAENIATGDKQGKFRGKNSRSDREKRNAVFQGKKSSKRLRRNSAIISDNDKSEVSYSKRDNARVVRKRSSVLGDDIQFVNSNHRFVKVFVTEDDLNGNSGTLSSNVNVKSKYKGSHKPKGKTKARSKRSVFQGNAMNTDHTHHNDQSDNTGRKRSISHETLKRNRRHVGPHDGGGMQRLLSTGTLAPVLNSSSTDAEHSIDVIFATYWFYPAKTRVILPAQQKCIDEMMDNEVQRFDPNNQYYGDDHDAYEDKVMDMCLGSDDDGDGDDAIHESQTNYNPFNIHMGQMMVYRMRLKCTCEGDPRLDDPNKHCSRILPYSQQQWAAYMGTHGNSLFKSRDD